MLNLALLIAPKIDDAQYVARMGMPETWIHQNSRPAQLEEAGIDSAAIHKRVNELIDEHDILPLPPPREDAGVVSV